MTNVFQKQPAVRQAFAASSDGFSQKRLMAQIVPPPVRPRTAPRSIQPYSTSGPLGSVPNSTICSGCSSTHLATDPTWAMNIASSSTK